MQMPLVLVSNHIKAKGRNRTTPPYDLAPRQDYIEIAQRLGGELVGYDIFDPGWFPWMRQVEKRLKLDLVEALAVASRASKHNFVLSTSEKIAIPLAVLLTASRQKTPHIVIGHKLSTGLKAHLLHRWPLHRTFTHMICVCRTQANYAIKQLGMPKSRVDFVHDKVDHRFFYPLEGDVGDYILAVGQEQRDYQTLLQALAGTGKKLVILASSPWSTSKIQVKTGMDVTVLSHIPYQELKTLYAKARLVVVPLFDVDYAAGVNTLLEAMAMAKPVIVSRTKGIIDYVSDQETGTYVSPGDVEELRTTILALWQQPAELNRLGTNARQAVEQYMNMDIYVNRVVEIAGQTLTPSKG